VSKFLKFFADEDGAVTVDWVVLTAMLGILGIAVQLTMGNAALGVADNISTAIDANGIMSF
jgi:Flp pilus assembly pilin Flp